jgi:molybdopterin synthase sulfur carrier subunit
LKVSIRFFTSLREIIGSKEEILSFTENEEVTINKVLETLAQRHGERFVNYVYDAKTHTAKSFLQFFINGRSAATVNGLETELSEGDVLAIVPPVGGG